MIKPDVKRIIFTDLDGTLLCLKHRLKYLVPDDRGKKDYVSFNNAIEDDTPKMDVVNHLHTALKLADAELVVLSGRSATSEITTLLQLESVDLYPDHMFMRRTRDYRPAVELKLEHLGRARHMYPNAQFLGFYEDDPKVVDMFRSMVQFPIYKIPRD